MGVRAKFKVNSITRQMGSKGVVGEDGKTSYVPCEMRSINMSPVYGNGDPKHENTKFWEASPSGSLQLNVVNLAAAEGFELDQDYYLDFTKAD